MLARPCCTRVVYFSANYRPNPDCFLFLAPLNTIINTMNSFLGSLFADKMNSIMYESMNESLYGRPTATLSKSESSHMNMLVSCYYPRECHHKETDLRKEMCCVLKMTQPIDLPTLARIFGQMAPKAVPWLVRELSCENIHYASLFVKFHELKQTTQFVPIVVARYSTVLADKSEGTQIRVLDTKPLDVDCLEVGDVVGAIVKSIEQVNLRGRIVSIEIDPNSAYCHSIRGLVRSEIIAQFGPDRDRAFHLDVDLSTALLNIFEDVAKQMFPATDLTALVQLLKTNSVLSNLMAMEPAGKMSWQVKATLNGGGAPMPEALLPPDSILHSRQLLVRAAILFDILRDFSKNVPDLKPMYQFTSVPLNKILLLNLVQLGSVFIRTIAPFKYEKANIGHAFSLLPLCRKTIGHLLQQSNSMIGIHSISLFGLEDFNNNAKEKQKFTCLMNALYGGVLHKCAKVEAEFIDPIKWIALDSKPNSEQVRDTLDYFAQHGYPQPELDLAKLDSEIELVNRLITAKMLNQWTVNDVSIEDRWNVIFRLDHAKQLELVPRLIELALTAIPLGPNQKVNLIYDDVEHFWEWELKRNGPKREGDWAKLKTTLMAKHNLSDVDYKDVLHFKVMPTPASSSVSNIRVDRAVSKDTEQKPKKNNKKNKKKGKGRK